MRQGRVRVRLRHLPTRVVRRPRFAQPSVRRGVEPRYLLRGQHRLGRRQPSGFRLGTRSPLRSSADSVLISKLSPPCALSDEHGSMVLGFGVLILVLVLSLGIGAVGTGIAGYVHAAGAADAAALAAAPVTFRPFGARGSPRHEAARFASSNGTRLVQCVCRVDRSWSSRTVSVIVERSVDLPGLGTFKVRASSRATFEPEALLAPQELDR